MNRRGQRLRDHNEDGVMVCPEGGLAYNETKLGILRCVELSEDPPLPAGLAAAKKSYNAIKLARV